jgi:hypothetical protein
MDAIVSAKLEDKAIEDDAPQLSTLDLRERVMVLKRLGQSASKDDVYHSLPKTAHALQIEHANLQNG